jgi:hypothetical protein
MAAQTKSVPIIAAGSTIKRTTSARTTIFTYEPFPAKTNRIPDRGQSAAGAFVGWMLVARGYSTWSRASDLKEEREALHEVESVAKKLRGRDEATAS